MRQNIVLIDFENVQPDTLTALAQDHFRVLVFVGAQQTKVSFEIAASLQRLGTRAEYIKVKGHGSNALDFHIAYYLGRLAAADPLAYFHIVSKDTGFDPLIEYLKANQVLASRVRDVTEITRPKVVAKKTPAERRAFLVEKLRHPKYTKPRTVKKLRSSIASLFQKQLSDDEVTALVTDLVNTGEISITGEKIVYASETGTPS
jgi:hypothetical protein